MPAVTSGTIALIGAGGSVGKVVYDRLRHDYNLRLADRDPIEAIRARPAKKSIVPAWTESPEPPHEWVRCDVTNPTDVAKTVAGCEAVINLTVNRQDPATAHAVNIYGTYNILRASVEAGVRRVIHSGPWTRIHGYESDVRYEFGLDSHTPYASGTGLYPLTKGLSLKVVDAFADHHDLDVMTFLISRIRPHDALDGRDDDVMISFSVSWRDLAEAFFCGLRAPRCPRPHETFFIAAPLPFEKYDLSREKALLGWEARDRFEAFYTHHNPLHR